MVVLLPVVAFALCQPPADAPPPPLTDAQKIAMRAAHAAAKGKVVAPAAKLAGLVKRAYDNMLTDAPDESLRAKLVDEMRAATGELLAVKGQVNWELARALTPAQRAAVKKELAKPGTAADIAEVIAKLFKLEDK